MINITAQSLLEEAAAALLAAARSGYGERFLGMAIYGSVARSAATEASDLDTLIVADPLPNGRFNRVIEFQDRIEPIFLAAWETPGREPVDLSPVLKTPTELLLGSPLLFDMVEDARILHDPRGILRQALDRMKSRLERAGARRVWRGNVWWWDLKPDFRPGDTVEI